MAFPAILEGETQCWVCYYGWTTTLDHICRDEEKV